MDGLLRKIALTLFAAAFLGSGALAASSNPIGDFFKRLGNSIAHPRKTPTPRPTLQRRTTGKKQDKNDPGAPQDATSDMSPVSPAPTPTPNPTRTPMPVPLMVRTAVGVPPSKRIRRDLPYGIPVPNKPGLVMSPYSPKSGYVDVRGFSSGTEVKDPYTGKTFLTP
jgi:hypothetical protein